MSAHAMPPAGRIIAGVGAMSVAALLGACATVGAGEPGAALSPADFRQAHAADAPSSATSAPVIAAAISATNAPQRRVTNLSHSETAGDVASVDALTAQGSDVRVIVGPPGGGAPLPQSAPADRQTSEAPASAPVATVAAIAAVEPTGSPAMSVDALIGQINGRPLFASEFLAPMDTRLRAEAARMTPREWLDFARGEIARQLRSRVVNDLLLAEARASLTPQQRQGLLFFLENFRETLVSQAAGSQEIAERVTQEREGRTLDEKAREMLDQELLRMQLRRALADHAQVSWREVELEYERRKDEFNPPPTITLRMLRAPIADAERIARIEAAFATGEAFEAIAKREGDWNKEQGGLYPRGGRFQLDAPSIAEATIFGPAPLNDAARALEVGKRVGPIAFNDALHWLLLERVERTRVSLFEAQLELLDRLRASRLQEAEQRYLEELIGRGSLTDIQRMESRLMQFAIERYLLNSRP